MWVYLIHAILDWDTTGINYVQFQDEIIQIPILVDVVQQVYNYMNGNFNTYYTCSIKKEM